MFKKLKFIIYTKPFIFFAYYFIRIYSLSFRLKVTNESLWQTRLSQGKPVLICTWHQQFFSAIRHFKTYSHYHPGLMISQSKDGDLISGVARKSGWHTPRGSSSRGGKIAMDAMICHLKEFGFGAHILDGPTGPIGKVKAGVIKMANEVDALVVPFHICADHAWFFNSWDHFMLPKPFSRVTITFGQGLEITSDGTQETFERQRKHLETLLLPNLILHPPKQ